MVRGKPEKSIENGLFRQCREHVAGELRDIKPTSIVKSAAQKAAREAKQQAKQQATPQGTPQGTPQEKEELAERKRQELQRQREEVQEKVKAAIARAQTLKVEAKAKSEQLLREAQARKPASKGGKGKRGKGKGGFKGNCYYCNQPGHRLNPCPQKDADMAKGKCGKGKGMHNGKGKCGFGGGFGKGGTTGAWDTAPGLGSLMPQPWMGSLSWMNGDYYEGPNYARTWTTPDTTHNGPLRHLCALQ